jgi:Tol biopolymer transport system component
VAPLAVLAGASVLSAGLAGTATATGAAAGAAVVGGGAGKILYARDGTLAIRHPDGSGKQVVPRTKYWSEPQWSPNGHWIAAVHGQRATVLRPNGSHRHAISPAPPPMKTRYATSPSWSPNGRQVAYLLQLDGRWEIRIVRRGGGLVKVVKGATKYLPSDPAWSPDGNRIAFVGTVQPNNPSPQWDIFTVRVGNSNVDRLTSTKGADEWGPSWRPDGHRIVYQRDYFHYRGSGAVRRQLYVMTPSGANPHAIYEAPDFDSFMESPAYSPDGRWIAFGYGGASTSVHYGVRVVRADGSGKATTVSRDYGSDPSWR